MLLAIDVGNTNVVFALYDAQAFSSEVESPNGSENASNKNANIRARWRIATDPRRTADQYAVWLMQLLAIEGVDKDAVRQIIIATVVPRALHNLRELARKYFAVSPWVAGEAPTEFALPIEVDEPRSLGADRAINAIAAAHKYGGAKYSGALIIVDFGTATTIDAVGSNGAYQGGIIAPGVNLSLEALVGNTAKLPRIAIATPASGNVIGTNTEDQMLIGVYWGYVSMVEGLVARMRAQMGGEVRVVATGGLAALFNEVPGLFDIVDFDLTLDGLALLAAQASRP